MPKHKLFNGSIYHMSHFENLRNILRRRAFLSRLNVKREGISYRSIAFAAVQSLRDRIYVWDHVKQQYRELHSYFPLYFATHTPMLYVQYTHDYQDKIVIFEIGHSVLSELGVVFTDGNASNQQLSKYGREKVGIVPATTSASCQRFYSPDGPHGTNPNRSNFYADLLFLRSLNWDIINGQWFSSVEKKRIKHAEVLVPNLLPIDEIQGIYVKTPIMVQAVNAVIEECGLTGRIPSAVSRPDLYF